MRKLPPGNYNIICKGKSGELIELSPNPERKDGHSQYPINGILHIMANQVYGFATDGSYIYFFTLASFRQLNSISIYEYRLYKYSIVGGERIWFVELSDVNLEGIFILGNYIYVRGCCPFPGCLQRYSKATGAKYGDPINTEFRWYNNCFVDGNYVYSWHTHTEGFELYKFDSNLNQVSSVILTVASVPGYDFYITSSSYYWSRFMLGWDGSHLCGGYHATYRKYHDEGWWEYIYRNMWAKWSVSGGTPTSTWLYSEDENEHLNSGCGQPCIIIGDEIWAFGEYHDALGSEEQNPEKNAMYYNPSWRQTCKTYVDPEADFYVYGNFYRGHYAEHDGDSWWRPSHSLFYGGKFYYRINRPGNLPGVNEITTVGAWQLIRIV